MGVVAAAETRAVRSDNKLRRGTIIRLGTAVSFVLHLIVGLCSAVLGAKTCRIVDRQRKTSGAGLHG